MLPLHIFKPGTFTATQGQTLTFSEADLQATAQGYDPARHEAPLVVGHPELNEPAYGWVKALTFADGALLAQPEQVDPAFADLVNAGRFKKISAAFFTPTAPNNPTPGAYYLRHVGFLGAAAPAVKGLRTPAFADDDADIVTVEFSEPDPEPEPLPATYAAPVEKTLMTETTDALAAEKLALAQQKAALDQREAEITANALRQRRASDVAFADSLIQQGRLLPRDQSGVVELLNAVADSAPVEFAEDGQVVQQTPRHWLETFLKRLPVQVDFNERSAAEDLQAAAVAFAAPPGYQVDTATLARHQKALALSRSRNIPYIDALAEV